MSKMELAASAALVCVIVVFTVFAVGSQPKPFLIGGLAQYLLPTFLTLYLLVILYYSRVIVEVLATFFLGNRKQGRSDGNSWTVIIGYVICLILLILLLRSSVIQRMLSSVETAIVDASTALRQSQATTTPSLAQSLNPYVFYYLALVFLGIILASFGLLIGALHRAYKWTSEELVPVNTRVARQEALQSVQKAAKNLRFAGDYRETILNCYREMCQVLSEQGLQIAINETAREFSNDVSKKLGIGADAVRGLTSLFEEARYSDHQIDDTKRANAINELERLEHTLTLASGQGS